MIAASYGLVYEGFDANDVPGIYLDFHILILSPPSLSLSHSQGSMDIMQDSELFLVVFLAIYLLLE